MLPRRRVPSHDGRVRVTPVRGSIREAVAPRRRSWASCPGFLRSFKVRRTSIWLVRVFLLIGLVICTALYLTHYGSSSEGRSREFEHLFRQRKVLSERDLSRYCPEDGASLLDAHQPAILNHGSPERTQRLLAKAMLGQSIVTGVIGGSGTFSWSPPDFIYRPY